MALLREEKKKQIAKYLVDILQGMKLSNTAATLQKQAGLIENQHIDDMILKVLQNSTKNEQEKTVQIQKILKFKMREAIKKNEFQTALEVLEKYVTKYCQDKLEEYSLLFAQTNQKPSANIYDILYEFIKETNEMPLKRLSHMFINSQVIFMKQLGKSIVIIDHLNNGYIMKDFVITHRQEKLHQNRIYAIATNNSEEKGLFATGGMDCVIKIWNSTLQKLRDISIHHTRINTLIFAQQEFIAIDNNAVISLTRVDYQKQNGILSNNIEITHVNSFKLSYVFYDTKYLTRKKYLLGVIFQKDKGEIHKIDIHKKRFKKIIQSEDRIYSIEVSMDQKLLFANLSTSKINVYQLKNSQLKYSFTGFSQVKNLMRISHGGEKGKLLAVTSQDGMVCIYNLKKVALVAKLISISKKSINCVLWQGEELIFGCDGGNIELWGKRIPLLITSQEHQQHKNTMIQSNLMENEQQHNGHISKDN